MKSVVDNDLDYLTRLLKRHVGNVDSLITDCEKTDTGLLPLTWASEKGNLEISKLLLDSGYNVNNEGNEFKETPLHLAILYGHKELAYLLLLKGISLSIYLNISEYINIYITLFRLLFYPS